MDTKIKYIILLLMVLFNSALAQNNFVVYYTSGNVNILSGTTSSPANRGNAITKDNSLQLRPGGTCMLVGQAGKSMQLKTPGTYSFQQLTELLTKAGKDDVTINFFKYVYQNLFNSQSGNELAVTPLVSRGRELMLQPTDYSIILGKSFVLKWSKPDNNNRVKLMTRDHSSVLFDSVFKTAVAFNTTMISSKLVPGNVYEWMVEEAGVKQHLDVWYHFLVPEKKDIKKIKADLALLNNKKLSKKIKMQLSHDIYVKWMNHYSENK